MRVAGIDPGTIATGIGILEQGEKDRFAVVHYETIRADSRESLPERLREIHGSLREILKIYHPDVVALEGVFYSKDFKAAVKIGEARAAAILAAMELDISIEEYPPARVKQAICGNGRADKQQVQFMVKQILRLKEVPPADSADALGIAICHFHTSRWNVKKALAFAKS